MKHFIALILAIFFTIISLPLSFLFIVLNLSKRIAENLDGWIFRSIE